MNSFLKCENSNRFTDFHFQCIHLDFQVINPGVVLKSLKPFQRFPRKPVLLRGEYAVEKCLNSCNCGLLKLTIWARSFHKHLSIII